MTISTIKFSQFPIGNIGDQSNIPVGLGDGNNIRVPYNFWTTSTRPSSPYNGLLGYNTETFEYEYWNANTNEWIALLTSTNGFNWSVITASAVDADVNSGYISNNNSTPVLINLPATMNVGDTIKIRGLG